MGGGVAYFCLVIYFQNVRSFSAGLLTVSSNHIGVVALSMVFVLMRNFGLSSIQLDKQRIYVCTQRIITSKICKIFNHFKQTTLLLFYQHTIFKYIFNQTLYRSSLVIPQNMFIVTYFISACFKDMFVSAN